MLSHSGILREIDFIIDGRGVTHHAYTIAFRDGERATVKVPTLINEPEDALTAAIARAEKAEAEVERLREALTPSGDTKAAYIGEFSYREEIFDGETETYLTVCRVVPWTTIKEIMGAISARAAINGDSNG